MRTLIPRPVSRGATLGVAAVSGPLSEARLRRGIAAVRARGYGVRRAANLAMRRGYFAGEDAARAEGLNRLLRDESVRGIVFSRGGYGAMRVLDKVDYAALRRRRPLLCGFSDLTALFCAAWKRAGLVSLYGPMILNLPNLHRDDARRFWLALEKMRFPPLAFTRAQVICEGRAKGRLVGGCLTLLAHLLGTPYDCSWKGGILFIEDTGEKPYAVDRLLTHLRLAGKLRGLRGVLIGTEDEGTFDRRRSRTFREVYEEVFSPLGIPVVERLAFGHGPRKATLPFGGWAEVDTAKGAVRLGV